MLKKEMVLTEHKELEPKSRHSFIDIVGAVGSGKSFLASALSQDTGAYLLLEPFTDNPYLEDFYTKNPEDYSFDTQLFFLADDGVQRKKVTSILAERAVLSDAGETVNLIITKVHRDMGWMTNDQFEIYKTAHKKIYESGGILKPDVSIAVKATTENILNRIIKRGRPMELLMLQRFPQYFPAIVEEFNAWLKSAKHVVVVESDKNDIVSDQIARERVMADIKIRAGYFLHAPAQLNLKGNDGREIIFPDFLRPQHHIKDKVPSSSLVSKV